MNSGSGCQLPFKYDTLCRTNTLKSDVHTFVWIISDFSGKTKTKAFGECLKSPNFTINGPSDKTTKWHAEVYPKSWVEGASDYVGVALRNLTDDDLNINMVLFTLDTKSNKQRHDERKFLMRSKRGCGFHTFSHNNEIAKYVQNNTLSIVLDITVFGEAIDSVESMNFNEDFPQYHHQKQLAQDFSQLFESENYSDVTVTCADKEFRCHKNILASRSPVFKTMLESDMKEKKTGRIEIKNMSSEVVGDMLKYIYSGDAPNIDSHTKELFAAADQYQLEKLKEMCEEKLCSSIDANNCIELLVLGDLYHASPLKEASLRFLSVNMKKIKTSEWKESLIAHPTLLAEVMEVMLGCNSDGEGERRRQAFS